MRLYGSYDYGRLCLCPACCSGEGLFDAVLTLEVPGGHSLRPPPHSGIGIMAEIIVALEDSPYQPVLTRSNPLRGYLECQAKYIPGVLEQWLRKALECDDDGNDIAERLADTLLDADESGGGYHPRR